MRVDYCDRCGTDKLVVYFKVGQKTHDLCRKCIQEVTDFAEKKIDRTSLVEGGKAC